MIAYYAFCFLLGFLTPVVTGFQVYDIRFWCITIPLAIIGYQVFSYIS